MDDSMDGRMDGQMDWCVDGDLYGLNYDWISEKNKYIKEK
jgi:hypothetical protein